MSRHFDSHYHLERAEDSFSGKVGVMISSCPCDADKTPSLVANPGSRILIKNATEHRRCWLRQGSCLSV